MDKICVWCGANDWSVYDDTQFAHEECIVCDECGNGEQTNFDCDCDECKIDKLIKDVKHPLTMKEIKEYVYKMDVSKLRLNMIVALVKRTRSQQAPLLAVMDRMLSGLIREAVTTKFYEEEKE